MYRWRAYASFRRRSCATPCALGGGSIELDNLGSFSVRRGRAEEFDDHMLRARVPDLVGIVRDKDVMRQIKIIKIKVFVGVLLCSFID
mgnify:CR=1 FL=1